MGTLRSKTKPVDCDFAPKWANQVIVTLRQGLSSSSPLPSPRYRTDILICPLEKSLILFIFNIIIRGPLLPSLAIKIDEMGNADMIVLQMLSERFAYIIKSLNEDDE